MGIRVNDSSNCTGMEMTLSTNGYGVILDNTSTNNSWYHNNFMENTQHASDSGTNSWDHLGVGNYWDDYTGDDNNENGIGDTPYDIAGGMNQDRYPLMEPLTNAPVPDFSYTPIPASTQDVIEFTDLSVDMDGFITGWWWQFDDNTTSTLQHPTHQYADDGVYNVTLRVTDNYGVQAQISQQVTVMNVAPTANFTYYPHQPTDLDTVVFNDTSIDPDGVIVNWSWDFGDGNQSMAQHPTHQYQENGTYTVVLQVRDDDQATHTFSMQLIIANVAPTAQFSYTPQTPTTNDTIVFTDLSHDHDGSIVSWSWDFGDGTSSTESSPSHQYTSEGTYTVALTVVDNDGASTTLSQYVVILLDVEPSQPGEESIWVYVIYLGLFIAMIGMVFVLIKKYEK